jgi:acyl dehydratase
MSASVSFDNVDVGDELPTLHLTLTSEQVKRYALAANMPGPRFLSDEAAKAEGLPGQIAPGNFSMALLSRQITDWSPDAELVRLSTTFRGLVRPNHTLVLRGVITEKHASDHGNFIECDLVLENADGDRWVTGTATVRLPAGA